MNLFVAFGITASNHTVLQKIALDLSDYHPLEEPPIPESAKLPPDLLDMEQMAQDLILEAKQIRFPEYPGAFNPSIIRWNGRLLLSFRIYNLHTGSTNPFALVWLDENFNPISVPQVFELPYHNPVLPSKQQDPRLISVNGRLFIVYNNQQENVIHREMRRMFIVEMNYDGDKFIPGEPECLLNYEGQSEARFEKNWVPFEYNNELMLAYSLAPHRILRPLIGQGGCETVAISQSAFKWNWGVPRGGTQALLEGNYYLSFFHSSKDIPSVQSNGKKITHYVMGAYLFDSHPPFTIRAISPSPIVAKDFYRPPYYKTWKPLRCVFPAGIVIDENYVWLAYGRQDHEIWIAKIDKKKLIDSLIPVENIP
jgi:predicted GH43/DUF377 family glycosyl hydrolase